MDKKELADFVEAAAKCAMEKKNEVLPQIIISDLVSMTAQATEMLNSVPIEDFDNIKGFLESILEELTVLYSKYTK